MVATTVKIRTCSALRWRLGTNSVLGKEWPTDSKIAVAGIQKAVRAHRIATR